MLGKVLVILQKQFIFLVLTFDMRAVVIFWVESSHQVHLFIPVALQSYRVVVHEEQVVLGNEVLLKCIIPSFQADFVSVVSWQDSEGVEHPANHNEGNSNNASAAALETAEMITIVVTFHVKKTHAIQLPLSSSSLCMQN